mmetsp:Transcript_5349/g.13187  ORF Transcript_5349/g.13187 Transcript_5349/m.13187 type:complete len:257 (-) Transcript_5349:894-1664(-)
MMIWSTRSTVTAASAASLTAHHLVLNRSVMLSCARSRGTPVSMSTPTFACPCACAATSADTTSVALSPLFSASVRGTTSNASANFLIAYCSSPVSFLPHSPSWRDISSSAAPPPGTTRASRPRLLTAFTPSFTARSTSSRKPSVEPRSTTVEMAPSDASCCSTTQMAPPISCVPMCLAKPSSSGEGAPNVERAVAPVALHRRSSSNLEGMRSAIMPYFSIKCIAISPIALPLTTTLTPASAMALMYSSSLLSSVLL